MCWVLSQEDDVGVGDFIPGTFSLPSLRQSLKDMLAGLLDEVSCVAREQAANSITLLVVL
jgi:hypothetical protein